MTPTDQAMLDHLRLRLDISRREKEQALARLRMQEIEEARIQKQIQEAFPGEEIEGPAASWEDLSPLEQHVVHFIALRGRIYRIPDLLLPFSASSGATLSASAFRAHLTRLHQRGVLLRAHPGWAVHERFVLKAREPLAIIARRSGMQELGKKVAALRQPAWNPGSSTRRRSRGELPPALQALYDTTPVDRAFTTDDVMDAPGERPRIQQALRRLVDEKRLVRLSHGVFARAGVELKEVPLPAQLRGALAALPTDRAIPIGEWAQAVTASTSEAAVDAMSARAAVLKRQGRIQEVGKGLYRRRPRELPPAEPMGDLPADLRAVLAVVPERDPVALATLEVALDGERAKVSGQVFRLVQRGLLERCAVQTYRRVRRHEVAEVGLLRHFKPGASLRAGDVLRMEEGRFTSSGLARVNANLAELVRAGKLEKGEEGFRLVGKVAVAASGGRCRGVDAVGSARGGDPRLVLNPEGQRVRAPEAKRPAETLGVPRERRVAGAVDRVEVSRAERHAEAPEGAAPPALGPRVEAFLARMRAAK